MTKRNAIVSKAKEYKQRMLTEFSKFKRGLYFVQVEVNAFSVSRNCQVCRTLSNIIVADSKMDAYNKMANYEADKMCNDNGLIYKSSSCWDSIYTDIQLRLED